MTAACIAKSSASPASRAFRTRFSGTPLDASSSWGWTHDGLGEMRESSRICGRDRHDVHASCITMQSSGMRLAVIPRTSRSVSTGPTTVSPLVTYQRANTRGALERGFSAKIIGGVELLLRGRASRFAACGAIVPWKIVRGKVITETDPLTGQAEPVSAKLLTV